MAQIEAATRTVHQEPMRMLSDPEPLEPLLVLFEVAFEAAFAATTYTSPEASLATYKRPWLSKASPAGRKQ